jgi:hypothetical protein
MLFGRRIALYSVHYTKSIYIFCGINAEFLGIFEKVKN